LETKGNEGASKKAPTLAFLFEISAIVQRRRQTESHLANPQKDQTCHLMGSTPLAAPNRRREHFGTSYDHVRIRITYRDKTLQIPKEQIGKQRIEMYAALLADKRNDAFKRPRLLVATVRC
jgi:hypothetical protein